MTAIHSTKWFWTDWVGDEAVRRLTPAERGVWIDLLALAAAGSPTGYVCDAKGRPLTLEEIARVTNAASPDEVAKLIAGILEKGVASRDRSGRLFNRRMVRDAELRAKRSIAGKKGAAHTNLIWKDFSGLPRHLTQQNSRAPPPSLSNKLKTFSSENSAPRARTEAPAENPHPAGSLATALPTGALARQPIAEQPEAKPPQQATRAELEAAFARKRTANGQQDQQQEASHT